MLLVDSRITCSFRSILSLPGAPQSLGLQSFSVTKVPRAFQNVTAFGPRLLEALCFHGCLMPFLGREGLGTFSTLLYMQLLYHQSSHSSLDILLFFDCLQYDLTGTTQSRRYRQDRFGLPLGWIHCGCSAHIGSQGIRRC